LIAKPIDGSGSTGINIKKNLTELNGISKGHIVQPYVLVDRNGPKASYFLKGLENGEVIQVAEISVHYLISKRGKVMGRIATRNKLKAGVPIEIIPIDIPLIWQSSSICF